MAAYNSHLRHPRGSCHCRISGIQRNPSGHRNLPLLHRKILLSHCCSIRRCQLFSRCCPILDCTASLGFPPDSFWDCGWRPRRSPWTSFAGWGGISGWGRVPRSSRTFSPLARLSSSRSEMVTLLSKPLKADYTVTHQVEPNLPLTLIWKLCFCIRSY